ncbi:MAG: bifunctional riboflavin kinase/FMN adenylyltransferase, partial [Endomicrobia bacterium]|nr:bifunctional riboflavin kinase/FMN adenylyltransferase [Endomicrobiia bacterium]
EFFTHFITNKRISIIITGEDFRFGRSGCGDVNLLIKLGVRCRVSVIIVEDFKIRIDEKVYSVSSSLIREKIINGEFDKLNVLLGRRYSITGKIVKGQGIGHKIGVPTINFATDAELVMPYGVIAGFCKLNKILYPAVANFGYRPTLDGKEFVPEIHILDKKIKKIKSNLLEFIPILKIREEKKFNSLIELKKQIQEDIKIAKKYLC